MARLRTLQQGKKKYYYLEHTLRTKEGFQNRRKYLGDSIPKNVEELKEHFVYELLEETYGEELLKRKVKFEKDFASYPDSYKEKYLESFMIRFTYNTNRIEGGTLTLKETADLLQEQITPANKKIKDVKEAEAHKKMFYDMLAYNKRLNLNVVLHWHRELFKDADPEIAGIIRKHAVAIARSKTELPLPAELNTLLDEFFIWYNKNFKKLNPVILAALVHLKFVSIHPFSDGNGRISRLLMNHTLHSQGYPMLNIEYTNRNAYYTALERSQTRHQEHIFVTYIVKRSLQQTK
ncbi:MAG: Fic family protein [archaeon]